jgi:hypothetical protein
VKEKNMRFMGRLIVMGLVVVLASGLCGCKKKDSGEKAGAAADKAVQDAGTTAGKAVQDAGTAADKAVQTAGKAVENAGKEVQKSAR